MVEMVKVLIIDSGARGHALAKLYRMSSKNPEVVVAPGNHGMIDEGITIYQSASLKDANSILKAAQELKPDLIDVAQDDALAAGTVDLLKKHGFRVFGPTQKAARIESNKEWSRQFMARAGIPRPDYGTFNNGDTQSIAYAMSLLANSKTVFFKASGLYAGKGVIPATDEETARAALKELGKMGDASQRFLVEDGMVGEEFSYYAIVDGKNFKFFKSAQDNKRVWDGDKGPNTGGMGANSPALVTKGLENRIERDIMERAVEQMIKDGTPYTGILYLGGMVDKNRNIKVVEFNSRWGDPECHTILPGIQSDYYDLVNAAIDGKLNETELVEDDLTRVCVIGASVGYPGPYPKGKKVLIDSDQFPKGTDVLFAGVKREGEYLVTNGGRVFSIIGKGQDVIEARQRALQAMTHCKIEDDGLHHRKDIAERDVKRIIGG